MAIAEDTTNSPARVVSSGATTDSAAFTPPANCILVCFMHSDSNTGAADETLTASDSLAGTWSTALLDNARGGAAVAVSWRAIGSSPVSMTTSVTSNKGSVPKSNYTRIFTGTDLVAPFGASSAGATAAISVVSTAANSWVWSAHLGSNVVQTAGALTTQKTQFGGFDSGDAIGVYASTNTTAGSGTTITLTEVGGTTVHHLAIEILPPSSGGATLNGAWAPTAVAALTAAAGVTKLGTATLAAGATLTTAAGVTKLGTVALAAGATLTTASVVTKLGAVAMTAAASLAATGTTQAAAWAPSAGASLVAAASAGLTPLVRAVLVPGGTIGSTLVPGGAAGSSLISGGAVGSTLSAGGV